VRFILYYLKKIESLRRRTEPSDEDSIDAMSVPPETLGDIFEGGVNEMRFLFSFSLLRDGIDEHPEQPRRVAEGVQYLHMLVHHHGNIHVLSSDAFQKPINAAFATTERRSTMLMM
jgi:hypothetical protein